MNMMKGSDWSLGLNSATADTLSDAELLATIGRDLQSVYREVLHEPLPEHLAVIVERLDQRDRKTAFEA